MADTKVSAETTVTVPALTDFTTWIGGGTTNNKITGSLLLALAGSNPGGRLTLTTAVPVTTADVTGATTIYYTPYKHNVIVLWDGSAWQAVTFAEVSLALGTLTSGRPYDVFGFLNAGALNTELLVWTSTTARATAITLQDGRYCKSGDKTRLYLGTFYTTATTTTEDSGGGTTTQVGGKRFVWNMYNRVLRQMSVKDTTDNWAYTTNTWRQANGAAGNKCECVTGLGEDSIFANICANAYIYGSTRTGNIGIGLDSTTVPSGLVHNLYWQGAGGVYPLQMAVSSLLRVIPAVGYHAINWIERGPDGTCLMMGDDGAVGGQGGLSVEVWA